MIELKDIVVKFGDFEALHNINVNVKEGEFFTFLGPSGCGKTTTLRTITGFIEPVSGTVSICPTSSSKRRSASCPAVSSSALPSPAPSSPGRVSSAWTSRCPIWTRNCAFSCAMS